jgi:histidinol phosphatase-like PHP family hydrolase
MTADFLFSDLHVHTNKSLCAPRDTVPASYVPYCKDEGIRIIGISDHVYPEDMLAQYGYPEDKRVGRLLDLRPILKEDEERSGIRYLLGCEIDYFDCVGYPYISPEESVDFDYVLFASSHILNYPHMYTAYDLGSPDVLRRLTIERFIAACKLDYPVPMGICHPLYPICSPHQAEIIDGMSDATLKELFSMAAEKHISIEIHACLYRKDTPHNEFGLSDHYLRILAAAKDCGCKFHMGSDAHEPRAFVGSHEKLRKAAELLHLTEDHIWDVAKGILPRKTF